LEPLRILLNRPDENKDYELSNYSSFFSVVKELENKFIVEVLWIVENGGYKLKKYKDSVNIYNLYSYHNYLEILNELKPDIVITIHGDQGYIERSMLKAARYEGIPSVDIISSVIEINYFKKKISLGIINARLNAVRDHGRILVRKYRFLLRTLKAIRYGYKLTMVMMLKDIYIPVLAFIPRYNHGGADLNIVSNTEWIQLLTSKGINKDKVVVTGDCFLDTLYEKLRYYPKQKNHTSNKLFILLVTSPLVEHGYWTPRMRAKVVYEIISSIKDQILDVQLQIKIHPITENRKDYEEIVSPIDENISIIQSADLTELIDNSDIIVGFGATSAYFQALLLSKPVLLANLFGEDNSNNIYIRENLITECKSTIELINHIKDRTYMIPSKDTLDDVIQRLFYRFDGKCSSRAANHIINLINSSRSSQQFSKNG
jgi:hypothetical protein